MPFTFSHPAIVLPLNYLPKKWVSLTALVIGSLMPDLEAYVRFSSHKAHSHTWAALFWFCLPVGFLLSLLYHLLVRNPFIHNLPPFLNKKLATYTNFDWLQHLKKHWLVVSVSFLVGGASHLLWDSFSHYNGLLQILNPALTGNTVIWGYNIEIPYLIQYLNSILGLLIIAIAIFTLPAREPTNIGKKWWYYWMIVFGITGLIFFVRWAAMESFKIDDVIVSFTAALLAAILIVSIWQKLKSKRRQV